MSKKELITALKTTEVAANIDMRLSKSDIIDMIVEERRAELEATLEQLKSRNNPLMESLKNLGKNHEKEFAVEFQKSNKVIINAFKKAFPETSVKVETSSNSQIYGERTKSGTVYGVIEDTYNPVYVACTIFVTNKEDYYSRDKSHKQLKINGECKKRAAKLKKESEEVVAQIAALDKEIAEVQSLIADLSKRGGRFKAEFTKRMLAGTEEGKSILASLDSVRNIVKGIK